MLLLELALEEERDQHIKAYRPGCGNASNHGLGYRGPRPSGQDPTPRNPRYMSNVQDVFWCDTRGEKGDLVHAPNCDKHECFLGAGQNARDQHWWQGHNA